MSTEVGFSEARFGGRNCVGNSDCCLLLRWNMHVLQLGPFPPPEGGVSRNLQAIRAELQKEGHDCSVIVTSGSSEAEPEANVYHPNGAVGLIRLLWRLKFDVLHLHIGGKIPARVLALIAFCGMRARGRSVLTLHSGGYVTEKIGSSKLFSLTGMIFRSYRKIICVNWPMKEMFRRYGVPEDRLHVILPFSVEAPDNTTVMPKRLSEFFARHTPTVLTVGALEDEYEILKQIDAFGTVVRSFPEAGLVIVGSGSMKAELEQAIASKSYGNGILLAGNVPHKVTLRLISESDLLLRVTKYDGDAISVREALHLGTPVIATDNGMRPIGVHLVSLPLSADDLAERVVAVSHGERSPPARPQIGDGLDNIREVLSVYEEIANK
jgi:glycogen synthase